MPQPARQTERKITGALAKEKRSKPSFVAPGVLLAGLCFLWLVACVQFYHGMDGPQQQVEVALAGSSESHPKRLHGGSQLNDENNVDAFPDHYMTFSTACSPSQNWQSFLFFYYAHKVKQPGHVVRIASACSDEQRAELIALHESTISKLSPNFSIHFTPDYARVDGDNYKYYNKPFGVQHWLTHGLGYDSGKREHRDAIITLLDPDMILLRPLTYDFTESNVIIHRSQRGPPAVKKVAHGQPWASLYGFGNGPFRSVDLKHVFANHTDSPALRATAEEQANNYPGGPPYMATGRDMTAIVASWCELVPRVRVSYEHLLGEMYGWSLAAAHLGLPHTLAESFMISATGIGRGEGWPLVDVLREDEVCEYSSLKEKEDKLPYVMHYCQNYWLGKWFAGKYRLDSHFLSCKSPLLLEPPQDIGSRYDFYVKPGGKPYGTKQHLPPEVVKREQFMVCQLIARLNDAATWYKEQTCEAGMANYEKSFIFHHNLDPDNNEGGEKTAKW